MGPLEEEAGLFEVNYGSEETPITASGPHTKVGGNPATDRRPPATSPIDIALGRRRDVQQKLFPDGERPDRDSRDKSMDRVAGLLGGLPKPRHNTAQHTPTNKNLFDYDKLEFAQWVLGMEPAEEIVNHLRREPVSGPLWKELVTNGAGQLLQRWPTHNCFEHPAARKSGGGGARGGRCHSIRFSELRTKVLMELYGEPITSQSVIT